MISEISHHRVVVISITTRGIHKSEGIAGTSEDELGYPSLRITKGTGLVGIVGCPLTRIEIYITSIENAIGTYERSFQLIAP